MSVDENERRKFIIVLFNPGTTQERIRELVAAQNCTFRDGFSGARAFNVIAVPPGEDEAKVAAFAALPEVKSAALNETVRAT